MKCTDKIISLREQVNHWKSQGDPVILVPTMGNLHSGHLSLVEYAGARKGKVIVSIFVNPIQFVQGEDYENYPRTLKSDLELLERQEVDLVFNPAVDEIYPGGLEMQTRVTVTPLDGIFCGKFRPGHFTGVATVVTKLFNLVQPDVAIFGEKDYQQLLVIKKLVSDLAIPVEILSVPTVREPDGLAMSSRNHYLTPEQRKTASLMYRQLNRVADSILDGETEFNRLQDEATAVLENAGFRPEYFGVQDAETLGPPQEGDIIVLVAAWLGQARLIDNILIRR